MKLKQYLTELTSAEKNQLFMLGREINQKLINIHVSPLRAKDSDLKKVAKDLNITPKEAKKAFDIFTWGAD